MSAATASRVIARLVASSKEAGSRSFKSSTESLGGEVSPSPCPHAFVMFSSPMRGARYLLTFYFAVSLDAREAVQCSSGTNARAI